MSNKDDEILICSLSEIFLKDNKSSLLLVVTCSQFGVSKLISKLIISDNFFLSSS